MILRNVHFFQIRPTQILFKSVRWDLQASNFAKMHMKVTSIYVSLKFGEEF